MSNIVKLPKDPSPTVITITHDIHGDSKWLMKWQYYMKEALFPMEQFKK